MQHPLEVPQLLHLAAAMLCIPVQTATVERGFSMSVRMLMKGEVSEFDFDVAAHIVKDCGGMRSGSHPLTIGKLFKAVNDLELPFTLICRVEMMPLSGIVIRPLLSVMVVMMLAVMMVVRWSP